MYRLLIIAMMLAVSGCATRYTDAQLRSMSTSDLCSIYRPHPGVQSSQRDDAARVLRERGVFTEGQWFNIEDSQPVIGMGKTALLCTLGYPDDVNRTVTRYTDRKQLVYRGWGYVYIENGEVVGYQER